MALETKSAGPESTVRAASKAYIPLCARECPTDPGGSFGCSRWRTDRAGGVAGGHSGLGRPVSLGNDVVNEAHRTDRPVGSGGRGGRWLEPPFAGLRAHDRPDQVSQFPRKLSPGLPLGKRLSADVRDMGSKCIHFTHRSVSGTQEVPVCKRQCDHPSELAKPVPSTEHLVAVAHRDLLGSASDQGGF